MMTATTSSAETSIPGSRFQPKHKSPLPGVSDKAWAQFVKALDVQPIHATSESGGLGSYDTRPRRLAELGYAKNLRPVRSSSGRQIYEFDFCEPLTISEFLRDPLLQYKILCRSVSLYNEELQKGKVQKPAEMSDAGALAILHRGGRGALRGWPTVFDHTRVLYEAARGAF